MTYAYRYTGGCHCGKFSIVFETDRAPADQRPRICHCAFCRRHGAWHISDPRGSARITMGDPKRLMRYRFGLKTADFLICRDCGTYLGAVDEEAGAGYAVINVNCLDIEAATLPAPTAVELEGESEAERHQRHRRSWTPLGKSIAQKS